MQDDIVRRPPASTTQEPPIEPPVENEVKQNPNEDVHVNPQASAEPEPAQPETTDQPEELTKSVKELPVPGQPKTPSNFPTVIVAAAGIVCLVLVVSATFIGLQPNNSGGTTAQKPSTPASAVVPAVVNNSATDAAITEANGLQTNPAGSQTDLSDQALGL